QRAYEETHARWFATYERAKERRDQLAEEIRETYPKIVAQLTDLLQRARAVDNEVNHVNAVKPVGYGIEWDGNPELTSCELYARDWGVYGPPETSLDRGVRLPTFDSREQVSWPPHEPVYL